MVSRVLLRKLFRDMLGRAGALLALLVIVTIGVGIFVGMAAVYRDLYDARRRYYAEHHLADFTVDLKRAPAHVVEEVAAMPNVRAARGRVNIGARIDLDDVDEPITGTAISMPEQQLPVLNGILLRSGTWFADGHDKQVILDDAFARARGGYEDAVSDGHRFSLPRVAFQQAPAHLALIALPLHVHFAEGGVYPRDGSFEFFGHALVFMRLAS